MKQRPVITVKEARRLLGKSAEGLSDLEIVEIVEYLSKISKQYLEKKGVKKSNTDIELTDGLS